LTLTMMIAMPSDEGAYTFSMSKICFYFVG